ncbi:hypothetical protein [Staphylococcus epidermidis]
MQFNGGKVAATSGGVVLGVNGILVVMLGIMFFSVLKMFKYVCL